MRHIDFCEGQLHLLQIIFEHGPGQRADFMPAFTSFLHQHSVLRSRGTIDTAWSDRMRDLVDRDLVARTGQTYQITHAGEVYLAQAALLLLEESPLAAGEV